MENSASLTNETLAASSEKASNSRPLIAVKARVSEQSCFFTIVKRNGTIVPFVPDRITRAIESAFRTENKVPPTSPLPQQVYSAVHHVADQVIEEAFARARRGLGLTVEGIQDLVELKLMENGNYDVARRYIVYRDEHKILREDSPRNLRVLRRDGKSSVRFNPMKIAAAVERGFRATHAVAGPTPEYIVDSVNLLTHKVVRRVLDLAKGGTSLNVELIQDEVERQLMAEGHYQVAKNYILYRAHRAQLRAESKARIGADGTPPRIERRQIIIEAVDPGRVFGVRDAQGQRVIVTERDLERRLELACRGLDFVSGKEIIEEAVQSFYDGILASETDLACILAARSRIAREPNYSQVAARLVLDALYRETLGIEAGHPEMDQLLRRYFAQFVAQGIEQGILAPQLKEFDLTALSAALIQQRDLLFSYPGIQTLCERFLLQRNGKRVETPQVFWMRVAMGLAANEGPQKNQRAIEFYEVLSNLLFTPSDQALRSAGTVKARLSASYTSVVEDEVPKIFQAIAENALLFKDNVSLGTDWSMVTGPGTPADGHPASGSIAPFLRVLNDAVVAVGWGGENQPSVCASVEAWHIDIESLLEINQVRSGAGRPMSAIRTAVWLPDLFMKRVAENGGWTLFRPADVPDLHGLCGQAFEDRYLEYENLAAHGDIKHTRRVQAGQLWRKLLNTLFETGYPWLTFKDAASVRSFNRQPGAILSSSLNSAAFLPASLNEPAVCVAGYINLAAHVSSAGIDLEKLAATVKSAIRFLDNAIDCSCYQTEQAKAAVRRHRPIALGVIGFQEALQQQRISYASAEAVKFADESAELLSYFSLLASAHLARERGTYPDFSGSNWDKKVLPIETLDFLAKERGGYLEMDRGASLDWEFVRHEIQEHGMRHGVVLAISFSETAANICGVTPAVEPSYGHFQRISDPAGDYFTCSAALVRDLQLRGLWNERTIDELRCFNGSLAEIERIPEEIRLRYRTAFELDQEWLIECASRRQKWLDMGQSLTLYISDPSTKKLDEIYTLAWKKGLKSTFRLCSYAQGEAAKKI